jgi:hypothetical protein
MKAPMFVRTVSPKIDYITEIHTYIKTKNLAIVNAKKPENLAFC